ncbi:MAG: plasmid mobilization protein [Acidimicrobiales bacterium]
MSKINDLLAEEGTAAEDYEMPEELPDQIAVSRPNLGRGTVVSVRLSADEQEQLQRAAEEANLPLSTLIRVWALDRLRIEVQGTGATVAERLARLEGAVFQRPA